MSAVAPISAVQSIDELDATAPQVEDGALDFRHADGRTIPRSGYRPDDMIDEDPSTEGSCTHMVREDAAIYLCRSGIGRISLQFAREPLKAARTRKARGPDQAP